MQVSMKNLPTITIIEADQVYPFEWPHHNIKEGAEPNLSDITLIRHPLPVLRISHDNYLLLEETDFYHVLNHVELNHIPVQICKPCDIAVASDPVDLTGFDYDALIRLMSRCPDQFQLLPETVGKTGPGTDPVVKFEFAGSRTVQVRLRHSSRTGCPTSLELLFRAIIELGRYLPVLDQQAGTSLVTSSINSTCRLHLPTFTIEDVKTAATSDRLFPPGVLRCAAKNRALNIDFPVNVLAADSKLGEKQQFLSELITLRRQSRKTTCYEGRVYLFNR